MAKIGIASDIHLGRPEVEYNTVLEGIDQLVSGFKSNDVDGVFLLGDQIHEQSTEEDRENLRTVREKFSEFNVFHALIGNHDVGHINEETFVDIMDSPVNKSFTIDGQEIVMVDTGSVNEIQNIGEISEEGMDLCVSADDPIILTHFPVSYTDRYQDSPYFGEYPEGVFAINKFRLDQKRSEGLISPEAIITGHLHLADTFEDTFGCTNHILRPFMDFNDDSITGAGAILDTDTKELTRL